MSKLNSALTVQQPNGTAAKIYNKTFCKINVIQPHERRSCLINILLLCGNMVKTCIKNISIKLLPLSTRRSRWPWHLKPWQPRFCTNDGQCLPPFSGAFRTVRVRDIIPVPHGTSHSLQTPHSLTVQSITAKWNKCSH